MGENKLMAGLLFYRTIDMLMLHFQDPRFSSLGYEDFGDFVYVERNKIDIVLEDDLVWNRKYFVKKPKPWRESVEEEISLIFSQQLLSFGEI